MMRDTTILPPPGDTTDPLFLAERDDNDPLRWDAIRRDGEQWRVRREHETVRPRHVP